MNCLRRQALTSDEEVHTAVNSLLYFCYILKTVCCIANLWSELNFRSSTHQCWYGWYVD
uniref:Uncharacterized protein n=1 Tax=Anguilla anguilla TaxID=7936 RepID=A0A0E9P6H8_ANGAN